MANYCSCEKIFKAEEFKKGAYVKLRELPVRLAKELALVLDDTFTIKELYFKVNALGNVVTLVELDQLPGQFLSPSILEVKKILEPSVEVEDTRTLRRLIEENNRLSERNSYLESLLRNSLEGNFE